MSWTSIDQLFLTFTSRSPQMTNSLMSSASGEPSKGADWCVSKTSGAKYALTNTGRSYRQKSSNLEILKSRSPKKCCGGGSSPF